MKVRILSIHPADAWYAERDELLNLTGQAYGVTMTGHMLYAFDFKPDHLRSSIYIQFAEIEVLHG